jgi:hypothetical protein
LQDEDHAVRPAIVSAEVELKCEVKGLCQIERLLAPNPTVLGVLSGCHAVAIAPEGDGIADEGKGLA